MPGKQSDASRAGARARERKSLLWKDAAVLEPMVDDVEPAEEGMDQSPEDAMVDFPAQQRRKDGTDTAKYASAAASAAFPIFSSHSAFP